MSSREIDSLENQQGNINLWVSLFEVNEKEHRNLDCEFVFVRGSPKRKDTPNPKGASWPKKKWNSEGLLCMDNRKRHGMHPTAERKWNANGGKQTRGPSTMRWSFWFPCKTHPERVKQKDTPNS